jgi:hypothetical protein
MLINVELKTCSKYIHANEITITASNNVLDTSLLSEKGKRLFVEIFKDNYFATVPTVAYQAFIEAQNEEPIDPVEPDPEEPVEVPATYSIFKSGNTLTLTFSEPVKLNGVNLEAFEGTGVDFINATAIPEKELDLLEQALDPELVSIVTTANEAVLTLEDNFFVKAIFDMLDSSETNEIDLWAGNDDGIYKAKFIIKPDAYTTLTDKAVTTTDDTEITVTVTKETADEVTVTKGSFDSV